MDMQNLPEVLRNKETGRIGVRFTGYDYGACSPNEIPIIYQGDDSHPDTPSFLGTDNTILESHQLQPKDMLTMKHVQETCKVSQGVKTCRYLMAGSEGFECARISGNASLAWEMDDRAEKKTSIARAINCGGRYSSTK
jgi:hypothetical protein